MDTVVGAATPSAPLAAGSVSMRLYPHNDLPAADIVEELREQARLAIGAGLSGVMTNEHHNGFAGYMPNPVQTAGWLHGAGALEPAAARARRFTG